MSEYIQERERQKKREYHREWRKKHPEAVKAAQMRYWAKKAAEMQAATGNQNERKDEQQ